MTVTAFKHFNGTERDIFFTDNLKVGTFHQDVFHS